MFQNRKRRTVSHKIDTIDQEENDNMLAVSCSSSCSSLVVSIYFIKVQATMTAKSNERKAREFLWFRRKIISPKITLRNSKASQRLPWRSTWSWRPRSGSNFRDTLFHRTWKKGLKRQPKAGQLDLTINYAVTDRKVTRNQYDWCE